MVVTAAAIEWRQTAAWGAAALTGYYAVFVLLLMNGRLLVSGYAVYGTYENIAMQLAIAASALIVYATIAQIDRALTVRLTRLGRMAFGVCSMIWGAAHFIYMNLTAPLVPKWLPPGQVFWGCVTGVCFIAAGLGILTGIQARLAGILLTVMIASFGLLANGPMLVADPSSHFNWTESALNLALTGAAWVVADSLAQMLSDTSKSAAGVDTKVATGCPIVKSRETLDLMLESTSIFPNHQIKFPDTQGLIPCSM
ncbi:hypothetical protein [Tunturiibacter gelidoferens]|uniref:Putative membrane protein n=1 Tax=Tunturiibacter lichenicola TaxID=2051959 RepID=A0A7Y9NRF6_9BACT|nr:hypothetical protein [Edaphobacter lichenicola]NYF53525.1 putative membrane protein [Edaphobacter lichenicola]